MSNDSHIFMINKGSFSKYLCLFLLMIFVFFTTSCNNTNTNPTTGTEKPTQSSQSENTENTEPQESVSPTEEVTLNGNDALSENDIQLIETAFYNGIENYYERDPEQRPSLDLKAGELFYYGLFDGYHVFLKSGLHNIPSEISIGNEKFSYPSNFQLVVFNQGSDYWSGVPLKQNMVSTESLSKIAEIHKKAVEEGIKTSSPYDDVVIQYADQLSNDICSSVNTAMADYLSNIPNSSSSNGFDLKTCGSVLTPLTQYVYYGYFDGRCVLFENDMSPIPGDGHWLDTATGSLYWLHDFDIKVVYDGAVYSINDAYNDHIINDEILNNIQRIHECNWYETLFSIG